MLTLPVELANLIVGFAPLFSNPVWEHVQVLLVGAILAPGKRTVTSALRARGIEHGRAFSELPSRLESCALVEPCGKSHLAFVARRCLRTRRGARDGT